MRLAAICPNSFISCLTPCVTCHTWGQLVCNPSTPTDGEASPPPPYGRLAKAASVSLDGGVLDAKWSEHPLEGGAVAVLACATSTGRLAFYTLRDTGADGGDVEFLEMASSGVRDSLLLSLDWSRGSFADGKVRPPCSYQ